MGKAGSKLAPKVDFLNFRARSYSQHVNLTLQGSILELEGRPGSIVRCVLLNFWSSNARAKFAQSLSKVCPKFVQRWSDDGQPSVDQRGHPPVDLQGGGLLAAV